MFGFHDCKWKTVSSKLMQRDEGWHYTLFSQVCECGEWRIVQEEGHWKLENGIPMAV